MKKCIHNIQRLLVIEFISWFWTYNNSLSSITYDSLEMLDHSRTVLVDLFKRGFFCAGWVICDVSRLMCKLFFIIPGVWSRSMIDDIPLDEDNLVRLNFRSLIISASFHQVNNSMVVSFLFSIRSTHNQTALYSPNSLNKDGCESWNQRIWTYWSFGV